MKRTALTALLLFAATTVFALDGSSLHLLNQAWPDVKTTRVNEIGRGVGVVFSPDLSVPGNCRFYESLGFACFQSANWEEILDGIHTHNLLYPERRIATLVLETHGTNGNGLKLQDSYDRNADRSYISVGALQERLEPEGIYFVIISACNSGRLLRPDIYNALDPYNGDKLFLPATCGITNASEGFDAVRSPVMIITPSSSHIETTLVGNVKELAPAARKAILDSAKGQWIRPPTEFAVSDMMVQMLTRDAHLKLAANRYVDQLSRQIQPQDTSERNFHRFVTYVNAVAARQGGGKTTPATKTAHKPKRVPAKTSPKSPAG
ncbi:MAG TPA: hypothetical protein VG323_05845 [Thermoanaerobaculia bacterium]|nr:hypothetical protein [Thermoanaerobaculia bacterium]